MWHSSRSLLVHFTTCTPALHNTSMGWKCIKIKYLNLKNKIISYPWVVATATTLNGNRGALFVSSLIWCRLPSELLNTSAEISFEDELLQRVRRRCCCVDSGWPWKTHGTENTSTHSTAHTKNSYTSETLRDLTGPFFISLPSHPVAVLRKRQKWSWHTKWPLIPVFELPAKQRSIRLCQVLFCFLWPMNTAESSGEREERISSNTVVSL